MGYDIWTEVYNHNVVLSSTIKVTFVSLEASAVAGLCFGIYTKPMNDAIVASDLTTLLENSQSKYRIIKSTASNQDNLVLSSSFDAASWFGVADVIDNDDLCAATGTNPLDGATFVPFCGALGSSDLGQVQALVEMTFRVMFTEPKQQLAN